MKTLVIGMDEAGRGPWAGPVFCACTILPKGVALPGLNDSKLVSKKKREELFALIERKALFGLGTSSAQEIDDLGLIKATERAFLRALERLELIYESVHGKSFEIKDTLLMVDGRDKFNFPYKTESIIKGDQKIRCIAAASIMAKVSRDKYMSEMALKYPQYEFERHKGYGTALHQKKLQEHGPCEIHRQSFKPVMNLKNDRIGLVTSC